VSREFDDVLAFLERFQLGPAMEKEPVLEPDLKDRLERFADGLCDAQERAEICEVLRAHPALVRWVAKRVKERRKTAE
jgi:anti-sigma factor RsiW